MPVPFRSRLHSACGRLGLDDLKTVVVGVSGGMDSVVLWRSLHALGVPTVAAHVDYGLRETSGTDADFVRALATELGVPCHVREITLGDGNTQAQARKARYAFFREVAEASGAPFVAVAHTASDQAETVLMNLVRGAGLAGLAGMAETRPLAPEASIRLVRPLLGFTRADVETEARRCSWAWREDASNATGAYRRNRLRHDVMPLLEAEGGPGTALRIAAAAQAARAASGSVTDRLSRVGVPDARGGAVPLAALRVLTPPERRALIAEMVRAWAPEVALTTALVQRAEDLLDARVGARVEMGSVDVWRDRQRLVVAHMRAPWRGASVQEAEPTDTPYGTLTATRLDAVPTEFELDPYRAVVDARALDWPLAPWTERAPKLSPFPPPPPPPPRPLLLRLWREGDRLQPLGMTGTKLVSDVLTDDRVPPSKRRQRLVLASGDRIVWVVGHRLAHDARVTPETSQAVALEWRPFA